MWVSPSGVSSRILAAYGFCWRAASARAHAGLNQAAKIRGQPDRRAPNGPVNVKLVHTVERQMPHMGQPALEGGAL